ncbi:hypothetical protein LCGC14_1091410 [marine sediment metagenome]|uniref:CMP/dCMP-type deaminase domain-containing protein n=1 Tax=marine sediment metagenome TaxID=412755 RepID=A0A0F9PVD9_9ZZZZ
MNWDNYFLGICEAVSLRSKDTSTKLGAVIVGPGNKIQSTGYNSFPSGIDDNVPARQKRPEKYKWFEHAERNAIYLAARWGTSLNGCRLYCQWPPCPDCARGVIQAGIIKVICKTLIVPTRWKDDMEMAMQMLGEAGVKVYSV